MGAKHNNEKGKGTDNGHGGAGRGQGDKRLHNKQVDDTSKFPRLTGYFAKINKSASTKPTDQPATKRPRPAQEHVDTCTTFAEPQEPPEVAPAASSFLLGKGGIIAQALAALRAGGSLPCAQASRHCPSLSRFVAGLESLVPSLSSRLTAAMHSEVDHLSARMRREMKELADQVDARRDLLRNERDLFASSQTLASNRDWLMLMPNGRYCCGKCTQHNSFFTHRTQQESPWILRNGGVITTPKLEKLGNEDMVKMP